MKLRSAHGPVTFALGLGAILAVACRPGVLPERTSAPATVTGYFNVVVGDPLPPARAPQAQHYLTTAGGRKLTMVVDSAFAASLGDIRRFHGAVVRAVGRFRGADSTRLWVERIDSLPGRPPS